MAAAPEERARVNRLWMEATTFQELLSLNVRFLQDELPCSLYHYGRIDEETVPLREDLVALHGKGVLTTCSQPGLAHEVGAPSRIIEQRFFLSGICHADKRPVLEGLGERFCVGIWHIRLCAQPTLLYPQDFPFLLPYVLTYVRTPGGGTYVHTVWPGHGSSFDDLQDLHQDIHALFAREYLCFTIASTSFGPGDHLQEVLRAFSA